VVELDRILHGCKYTTIFSNNGPAWSLQWEYIANILYALVIRRLSIVALGICVAIFAVMTIILCLNIDVTGFLEERSYASYTVVGGWSTTPDQLQVGLTRLLYPFFCGLLISRIGKLIKVRDGFWWCSLMIIVLFCMPWMGLGTEDEARWTNGLYEAVCIFIYIFVAVCIFVLAILVAYGAYKLYDLPVREWLKKKWFSLEK
jgi:peptidoglycan/LPS O-acetylase OafA/YrhL